MANEGQIGTEQISGLLPKPMAKEILTKAYADSVVGRLSGTNALPVEGEAVATMVGKPVAGIVGEGEAKPVISAQPTIKTMHMVKAAAIVYWSEEVRRANPAEFLTKYQEWVTSAVRRSSDMAVIHGKNALTVTDIPGVEAIISTTNSVTLGTAAKADGGLSADILGGVSLIEDTTDFAVNGFMADKSMRLKLLSATDVHGRPIYTMGANGRGGVSLQDQVGDLFGVPMAYSDTVSGKIGKVEDTKTRLIAGDFKDNIEFGYSMNITSKKSTEATLDLGQGKTVSLFQNNLEAYLVEARFGWVIRDVKGFTKYVVA